MGPTLILSTKMISTKEQSIISLITSQNMYAIRTMLDAGYITDEEMMSAMLCICDSGESEFDSTEFLVELTNIMERMGCFEDAKYRPIIDLLFERTVYIGKKKPIDNIQQCVVKLIDGGATISNGFYVSLMHHDLFLYYIECNGITFTTDVLMGVCCSSGKSDNVIYAIDNMVLLGSENETSDLCKTSEQLRISDDKNLFKHFIQKLSGHPDINIIVFSSLHAYVHAMQDVIDCAKGLDVCDALLVLQKIFSPDCPYKDSDEFGPVIRDVMTLLNSGWKMHDARSVYNNVIERVAVLSEYI